MIKSFADKDTARVFAREYVRKLPPTLHPVVWRKLAQLHAATRLDTLRLPPGNRLEALKGQPGRAAQHSHQRPVAYLLSMEGRRRLRGRDRGLPLKENGMAKRKFNPVHPGVVLAEDFLKGLEISQYRLAKGIGVSPRRINEIVQGKRAITADTALRLGKFFGMEAQFWMNLQSHYDLEVAKDAIAGKLDREVEVLKAA